MSTDTDEATDNTLSHSVTYNGVEYTTDSAEYRLAKFKAEASQYLELQPLYFYYLFTEAFLMIDSRAKNMFPSWMGGSKLFSLPYDFDTANGINNEGSLVFSYNLEDIDKQPSGADVYNGQQSVLWKNIRAAFYPELSAMYNELRSKGKFNYNYIETAFENHQSKWPENLFNEDAQFKYIDPLIVGTPNSQGVIEKTDAYLEMLQGSKTEQRKWWLYNRFKYLDSKYVAGDAASDVIQLRGYDKADIAVTPFNDIYVDIKYANSLVQQRGTANIATVIPCPLDSVNDTEIYIYSASQIKAISDLTGLKVGFADFSKATKLQTLIVHDDENNPNLNLTRLGLGSNELLKTLTCKHTPNLKSTIDLSNCSTLETANFEGSGITGVTLANGASIQTLILPDTITNLTLQNTALLETLEIGDDTDYSNIATLFIENVDMITKDYEKLTTMLGDMADNSRVRLTGIEFSFDDVSEITDFEEILDRFRGIDDSGNNVDTAQVAGVIHLPGTVALGAFVAFNEKYPFITIDGERVLSADNGHFYFQAETLPLDLPVFETSSLDGHIRMTGVNDIIESGSKDSYGHLVLEVAD